MGPSVHVATPYPVVDGYKSNPDFFPDPDDGTPGLTVSDVTVQEPDTGSENADFTVTLRPVQTAAVTVDYATHDGTATAGQDYTAKSGTLTFAPGETTKTVSVPVLADTNVDENDENFTLDLANASGAELAKGTGTGTIATKHKVSGTLLDKKSRPLVGATVKINGIDPKTVTTNASGFYSARVLPGTYTVEPVKPPPGQPADGGAYEPKNSADCVAVKETCFVRMTADRVANFAYVFKVPLKGTIKDPAGKGVAHVPIRVTGTDVDGKKVDVTTSSDVKGAYQQLLAPGTYTATPHDPPGTETPGSYVPGACGGTKKPGACAFTIDKTPVTADFLSECERTLSFQTSMVAKGCLIRLDAKGKKYKAKGPVRINGIDFDAEQDDNPMTFDTEKKLVSGTNQTVYVSRGTGGTKWLAYHLNKFNQAFPSRAVKFTLALGYSRGGFNAAGTINSSLYGFPAHAPAFDIESTSGRTTLTLQLSLPPKDGAVLDGKTGLWKAPNDRGQLRVAYPNIARGAITLTNDNGLQSIEGSLSPSSIFSFGATSKNGVFGVSKSPFPVQGQVQLARVGFKYDFAYDTWKLSGTVVSHFRKPGSTAPLPSLPTGVQNAIGTNGSGEGFLSALIFDFDLGIKRDKNSALGVYINRAALRVNGINKVVYPPWFLYLQRLGIDMGRDADAVNTPLKLQLSGGLTFGPRIRSDLWFQELASLDVDGGIYVPENTGDITIIGNSSLRATNVKLISGRLVWNTSAGSAELSGDVSLNLKEFLARLASYVGDVSFLGTGRLVFPAGQSWFIEGDGNATLFGHTGRAKLRWNGNVLGICLGSGYGLYYDGSAHAGTCGFDAFGAKASASASGGARSFRVSAAGKPVAVQIRGAKAAPDVTVTGPRSSTSCCRPAAWGRRPRTRRSSATSARARPTWS